MDKPIQLLVDGAHAHQHRQQSECHNTFTVSRQFTAANSVSYTQTIGTVTCTGGAGTQATLAYSGLLPGDILAFAPLIATGATAIIEFEVQKH